MWTCNTEEVGRELWGLWSNPLGKAGMVWEPVQLLFAVCYYFAPHEHRSALPFPSPTAGARTVVLLCAGTWETHKLEPWSKAHDKLCMLSNFPQATVGEGEMGTEPSFTVVLKQQLCCIHGWIRISGKMNCFCLFGCVCNLFLIFLGVISHLKLFTNHTEPWVFLFAKGFGSVSHSRMRRLTARLCWL